MRQKGMLINANIALNREASAPNLKLYPSYAAKENSFLT